MTHPVSSFQKNNFLYPRTANDSYGLFAVKEVQRQNDMIRKYLKDIYHSKEERLGVTTNAEYGSYMHVTADEEHPMRQKWHVDYPDCPEDSPQQSPRHPILPPVYYKPSSDCQSQENPSLAAVSYRRKENDEASSQHSSRKESDSFQQVIPPKPLPPTKDYHEQFGPKPAPAMTLAPSPPLPPTERFYEEQHIKNTPRPYCRKYPQQPLPPLPEGDLSYGSPRYAMRHQSPENTPRLFPPIYYSRQPQQTTTPRPPPDPDCIHLGATRVPFSHVEAVELHLKDQSSILMNVDELKKRYIS